MTRQRFNSKHPNLHTVTLGFNFKERKQLESKLDQHRQKKCNLFFKTAIFFATKEQPGNLREEEEERWGHATKRRGQIAGKFFRPFSSNSSFFIKNFQQIARRCLFVCAFECARVCCECVYVCWCVGVSVCDSDNIVRTFFFSRCVLRKREKSQKTGLSCCR